MNLNGRSLCLPVVDAAIATTVVVWLFFREKEEGEEDDAGKTRSYAGCAPVG